MRFAQRMTRLGTETAFEVLAKANALEAQGGHIIHLEIGEPDFKTPPNIVDVAIQALKEGHHGYTPSAGILELRKAVASDVSNTRGIEVDPDQVVITPGGKPIIFFSMLALIQEGDEVIYPNPGFPIYQSMIEYVGGEAVPVPLREELDFRIDIQELIDLATDRTRMIILNSPGNPTGSVLTQRDIEELADAFRERDIVFLSDEIYSRILFEGEHYSIAGCREMQEKTIILDGFSKTYAMTGWRLGYGVMERTLAQQISRLMVNSNSCTAAFTQIAGVEALQGDQSAVQEMVRTFQDRRDHVVQLLNQIEGVSCATPRGAFYVFPNVKELGQTSSELQDRLLQECGVAVLAGTCFGQFGEGYLRLSCANSMENLDEGIRRIASVLSPKH